MPCTPKCRSACGSLGAVTSNCGRRPKFPRVSQFVGKYGIRPPQVLNQGLQEDEHLAEHPWHTQTPGQSQTCKTRSREKPDDNALMETATSTSQSRSSHLLSSPPRPSHFPVFTTHLFFFSSPPLLLLLLLYSLHATSLYLPPLHLFLLACQVVSN